MLDLVMSSTTENDVEQLAARILGLSRQELASQLLSFQSDFPMDFTRDYLNLLPLDRLQHLLLAAHIYHNRKRRAAAG